MIIGIDVAKDKMDVTMLPSKTHVSFDNSKPGIKKLLKQLITLPDAITMVALEYTGGYEKPLVEALVKAGHPTHIVAGKRIYYFAKMKGYLAKTDKLDSLIIAEYAQINHVADNSQAYLKDIELKELQSRQNQLKEVLANEKKRLDKGLFSKDAKNSIWRMIKQLEHEIEMLEEKIKASLAKDQDKQDIMQRLQTVKGVGAGLARTLVVYLPELGKRSRAEIAALAGVAPINSDSGKKSGYRGTTGGRAMIKKALYMAALSAARFNDVLRLYYAKLIAKGKKPKVALMAVMRKLLLILNAIQRNQTVWEGGDLLIA